MTSSAREDSPGVRLYPPVYYGAGLLAGWLLSLVIPTAVPGLRTARIAGAILFAAGFLLSALTFAVLRLAGTDPRPDRPDKVFVVRGPFRFSRNPMYVGMSLAYLGAALWFRWLWAVLLLPLVLAVLSRRVIEREERYLERKFGAGYDRYRQRVRRWI